MKIQNDITLQGFYEIKVFDKDNNLKEEVLGHNLLMDKFLDENIPFLAQSMEQNNDATRDDSPLHLSFLYCMITDNAEETAITGPGTISQTVKTINQTGGSTNFNDYVGQTIHITGDTTSQQDCKIISGDVDTATVDREQNFTTQPFIIANTLSSDVDDFSPTYNQPDIEITDFARDVEVSAGVLSLSSKFIYYTSNTSGETWTINNVGFRPDSNFLSSRFKLPAAIEVENLNSVQLIYTIVSERSVPNHIPETYNDLEGAVFLGGRSNFTHQISSKAVLSGLPLADEIEYYGLEFPTHSIALSASTASNGALFPTYLDAFSGSKGRISTIVTSADAPQGRTSIYTVTSYYVNDTENVYPFGNSLGLMSSKGRRTTPPLESGDTKSDYNGYQLNWDGPAYTLEANSYLKMITEWKIRRIITDD